MYRTHPCGTIRTEHIGSKITLAGWVQTLRKMGHLLFIDIRDRSGIVQLVLDDPNAESQLRKNAQSIGREWVIQATGTVRERSSKNPDLPTGDIEILLEEIHVLNPSETPPFTIIDDTDGGEELRMQYRYLDLRRPALQKNIILRHRLAQSVRAYLDKKGFLEIETPFLIKSTPEGARDYVVPSRIHHGHFYSLPQSPQTFKQLLMVAGFERYFQIVRCFRDEDLRADRQPEFTQIDCEMAFVHQDDVMHTFEGLITHLFNDVLGVSFDHPFPKMTYNEAMQRYGSDKPDTRFDMTINDITNTVKGSAFPPFNENPYVGAILANGLASYSRKRIDQLTEWVKRPQIGAQGLIYAKVLENNEINASFHKFATPELLNAIRNQLNAQPGDLILIIAGKPETSQKALGELRLHIAKEEQLLDPFQFNPLWVTDFPLLQWDDEDQRFYATHHPFTSPREEDLHLLETQPQNVRANAYDLVINGTEIGGGSIRIHRQDLQERIFKALGFTKEQALARFGFLINAFRYGAPPHGGIAFGFDRLCALFGGTESIRDYIAFPKNNAAKDIMIDAPDTIEQKQLDELGIQIKEQQ